MKSKLLLLPLAAALALSACDPFGAAQAEPTPRAAGAGLHCSQGDHGLSDVERGWGFCYPGTWRFIEKVQPSDQPSGVDTTFDVTDFGDSADPNRGLYGFVIIGTYDRGGSANLAQWLAANADPTVATQPISWADSLEALYAPSIATRYALTKHHVVVLTLHASDGNLDLEGAFAPRLPNWRFTY